MKIIADEDLKVGETYEVRKVHRKNIGAFYMIGKAQKNKVDALDILMDLNSNEKFAFKKLKSIMSYETNVSIFDTSTLSSTDKVRFSKGITGLIKKDVTKRISRTKSVSTFIINPEIIIPKCYDSSLSTYIDS